MQSIIVTLAAIGYGTTSYDRQVQCLYWDNIMVLHAGYTVA